MGGAGEGGGVGGGTFPVGADGCGVIPDVAALIRATEVPAWQGTANSYSPNGRNPVTLLKIAF
jgi:hypothetical protein